MITVAPGGFGHGYEDAAQEARTDLDVNLLVNKLKSLSHKVSFQSLS